MNNDIVPRKKVAPPNPPQQSSGLPEGRPANLPEPLEDRPLNMASLPSLDVPLTEPEKPKKKTISKRLVVGVLLLIILAIGGLTAFLMSPVDASAESEVPIEIVNGMVPGEIAGLLKEKGIIRSPFVFLLYTRTSSAQGTLQAGSYSFSPADSLPEIVSELRGGPAIDEIEVTFTPGATLAANKKVLASLGYDEAEIDAAFTAMYDHPLFESKPQGADLEGYLFGETHRFIIGTPVKTILERYFDDYYTVVTENNLVELYKQQGLTLFEGITLASIIQRESGGDDKAQIAQVFLLRLSSGISLGSDVTYQYIADKEGRARDVNYDSPYNTRRYTGLPPGPIATPGVAALKAVGSPASGDYLYFLSGDDNVTYFARTLSEHEANIRDHCQKKCTIL